MKYEVGILILGDVYFHQFVRDIAIWLKERQHSGLCSPMWLFAEAEPLKTAHVRL